MNFIIYSDSMSKMLLIILVCISIATWYLIVVKALDYWVLKKRYVLFLNTFRDTHLLENLMHKLTLFNSSYPFVRLTSCALQAHEHYRQTAATRVCGAESNSEFIMRTMRQAIDEETALLEKGLTMLAIASAIAPFIGLLGTVWGVHHALLKVSIEKSMMITHIAGPIGEALVMTALGLTVAIPAVLAYNIFIRCNRIWLARLDAFAHDLFSFLTTGRQMVLTQNK